MKTISHSIQDTFEFASLFSKQLKGGELIALVGDLGAGKTHFVKGLATAFEIDEEKVSSPTFSLMQVYKGLKSIVHLDLYRLESAAQLKELGLEDYIQSENIIVVEWADKFIQELKFDFKVEIRKIDSESREIEIQNL